MARRVLEALAGPLTKELQAGDDHGKQLIIHISPRSEGVRIQLPAKVVSVERGK